MTVTLAAPPAPAPSARRRSRRARVARLERPLLLAGLALVTLHLLDLALSGPDTSLPGLLAILAVPAAWAAARRHVTRPTRLAAGVVFGLLALGFGVASHGLHAVNSGLDATDVTGIGFAAGGLLLLASGLAALAAPRRAPRRPALPFRLAHGAGWAAGAAVMAIAVFVPVLMAVQITHAPRWAIDEAALGIAHEEVRVTTADGRRLSAWYVPPRNGTAVLLSHGSGGSRARVTGHVRMLARHGYGVLALDLPGNGESDGRSNGLGSNAQPAIDAALDHLDRRPEVERIAGFGVSLGAEVLLEAAARDDRLRAVVGDGPARPQDGTRFGDQGPLQRVAITLGVQAVRGVSGMRSAPSLVGVMPHIAPRPVLLIAGSGDPDEIPTVRGYRDAGGSSVEAWELQGVGHTAGLRARPAAYERRTIGFLDRALVTRR